MFLICYCRDFEAEISYIPVEEHQSVVNSKTKCYSRYSKFYHCYFNPSANFTTLSIHLISLSIYLSIRCPKCSDYTGAVESPGVINEKGASVLAAYSNVDSKSLQVSVVNKYCYQDQLNSRSGNKYLEGFLQLLPVH